MDDPTFSLPGLRVFERGWLSSNNILLQDEDADAVLVDSGHVLHAAQTEALLRQALAGQTLAWVVNTHLHADHCGGNARLQRAFGCRARIPAGPWAAALAWDEAALSYAPTGQQCERFVPDDSLQPGQVLEVGRQRWLALAAPGHDPHSLILFNERQGTVITADALWERGFGIGHGAPFSDLPSALARARERLAAFRAEPRRHARHAIKALLKFHLLEVQAQSWDDLLRWFERGSLYRAVWQRMGEPEGSLAAFLRRTAQELASAGVLALRGDRVFNA
jgi:glyoxylase-like metal-dependent hydrolase (beta-lactamase superfamily II)